MTAMISTTMLRIRSTWVTCDKDSSVRAVPISWLLSAGILVQTLMPASPRAPLPASPLTHLDASYRQRRLLGTIPRLPERAMGAATALHDGVKL